MKKNSKRLKKRIANVARSAKRDARNAKLKSPPKQVCRLAGVHAWAAAFQHRQSPSIQLFFCRRFFLPVCFMCCGNECCIVVKRVKEDVCVTVILSRTHCSGRTGEARGTSKGARGEARGVASAGAGGREGARGAACRSTEGSHGIRRGGDDVVERSIVAANAGQRTRVAA